MYKHSSPSSQEMDEPLFPFPGISESDEYWSSRSSVPWLGQIPTYEAKVSSGLYSNKMASGDVLIYTDPYDLPSARSQVNLTSCGIASSNNTVSGSGSVRARQRIAPKLLFHLPCPDCDKVYTRKYHLYEHIRKVHNSSTWTVEHRQKEGSCSSAEAQDEKTIKSMQHNFGVELMGHQTYDPAENLDRKKVNKKRGYSDDDASRRSGALTDSSDEGDDDSDCEYDDISTDACSQWDGLPSFLPYIRSHGTDDSSPCSDSPDNRSTTSGGTSDTSASVEHSLAVGNGLQGNGSTSPSSGTGLPNNSNNRIFGTEDGIGKKYAPNSKPLPLICWYASAGGKCPGGNVKRSTEVRHLLNDHAWGRDGQSRNHRLSDACQRCKRLFLTQELLEKHVQEITPQESCRTLSLEELKKLNREPSRLGMSLECKGAIQKLRKRVDRKMAGNDLRPLHDDNGTMALLEQRVESNVQLYINGSDTNEKTAKSELWKWYLIFKQLRPDDEVPKNPFVEAKYPAIPTGKPRDDALRIFMHNMDQAGCLPVLSNEQRNAMGRVFLDTLEMLGANEANEANKRHRSVRMTSKNPCKRPKLSPREHYVPTPHSVDPTVAPTILALAQAPTHTPAPTPALVPLQDPIKYQPLTYAPAELQHEPQQQTRFYVPPPYIDFDYITNWELPIQQQTETEAQWPFDEGDLGDTNP